MHTLIVGKTASGKSSWALRMVNHRMEQGGKAIILDPNQENWGDGVVFASKSKFLDAVKLAKNCLIIVDEGGESLRSVKDAQMISLATRMRHSGHDCVFISHRCKDIRPVFRTNVHHVCAFNVPAPDAKILYEIFGDQKFLECPNLAVGEFIWQKSMQPAVRMKYHLNLATAKEVKSES